MCVLCGQMFTEIHWSERLLDPDIVSRGASETIRRQGRHARTRLLCKVLAHYGLDVRDDWSAMNYVVDNRKGMQQVVGSVAKLWHAAAKMAGRTLDPLDFALLQRLRGESEGMTPTGRRAVTVLSGFLGSGKTTLLRRYLAGHGAGVAVIINEFGAIGVDHHLVRMVEEQSVLLQGACVCCTRRKDLVRPLRDLLDLEQSGALAPMAQVVVETSGLADPVLVLFTIGTDPVLQNHFAPASVVVTLDALSTTTMKRLFIGGP